MAGAAACAFFLGALAPVFADGDDLARQSADELYRKVGHLMEPDLFASMSRERQEYLVRLATEEINVNGMICFGPGSDPDQAWAFYMALADRQAEPGRYQQGPRWSQTAVDGFVGEPQGDPITITYSFVPDGTTIPADLGSAVGASVLFARMNTAFGGSPEAWQRHFHESFQRWGELSGVKYVYEPNDDGSPLSGLSGSVGVRGDVRIGMKNIDGGSNVLAYNYFPDDGDMVLDSSDITGGFNDPLFLQNVIEHEHGHGLGMEHVCPIDSVFPKLMEPFVSVEYHGVRHDDTQNGQRHYGDRFEPNDSAALATLLGERIFFFDFESDGNAGAPAGFEQVSGDTLEAALSGGQNWQTGIEVMASGGNISFAGNATRFAYINDARESPANGGEDLALRTIETFDTSGAASLTLQFDYNFPQNGIGVGGVYVRNETLGWTQVYNLLGDSVGWRNGNIDLDSFRLPNGTLADFRGQETRFAFRLDDENGRAGGFALDNVELAASGAGFHVVNVSIDDNADSDWFEIPLASGENALVEATVRPIGETYRQAPQDFFCNSGTNRNSLTVHNLGIEIRAADNSVLATANASGVGQTETLDPVGLAADGGPYYIRVFGATANDIQLYTLDVRLRPWTGLTTDLSVSINDSATTVAAGGTLSYVIEATNNGPDDAAGARVLWSFPAQIASASWTAAYEGGASGPASGEGAIDLTLDAMPADSRVIIAAQALVDPASSDSTILAEALVIVPDQGYDPDMIDNLAADSDTQVEGSAGTAPRHVENFQAYLGVAGATTSSPNDTLTGFELAAGAASTSTEKGFASSGGFDGSALEFDGREQTALRMTNEFSPAAYVDRSHQIAFWFNFSDNSTDPPDSQTQLIAPINQGGTGPAYVIRAGKNNANNFGAGVLLPRGGVYIAPANTALAPNMWHRCVVQYASASNDLSTTRDAGISIWFNPQSAEQTPNISFLPASNTFSSENGDGPLGGYGFGPLARAATQGPTVYIDKIGTWNGFGEPGRNSLQEAIDFLGLNGPVTQVSTGFVTR